MEDFSELALGVLSAILLSCFLLLFIIGMIFTIVIFSVFIGIFSGYVLSLTFVGDMIRQGLVELGFETIKLTHLGALLGFVGSLLGFRAVNPVISVVVDKVKEKLDEVI